MELNSIITLINTKLAGELLTYEDLKIHMDSVIDEINDNLNAIFPAFSEFTASEFTQYPNYNLFPDKYIRSVVVPGAAFKWLITDEEGAEVAEAYETDYLAALFIMQRDYSNSIPSEYQAEFRGYLLDTNGTCTVCGCNATACSCLSEPSDYFPSIRYVDRFATGSDWDGLHLTQGNYHFWVDSNGDYRYKNGTPTDEFDGTVIGGLDTAAYDQALIDLQTDATALDARVTLIEGGGPAGGFPHLQVDTTPAVIPTAIGATYYNETCECMTTVYSANVMYNWGEEMFLPIALNNTGATITNGKIVRISGASGNRATMALVDGTDLAAAHDTIAMATEDVANNTQGRFTTQGIVRGLNTSAFADGAELWLDPTSANGDYTDVEPTGAQAYIRVGYVFKTHVTDGWIYFDVHQVPHVDTLANADITSIADKDRLVYDSASATWKNEGPKYGEIYASANATALTLTTQNTWYQVAAFNNDGASNGVTVSHVENHIVAPDTGVYKAHIGVSFSGTGVQTYELELKKNNGATSFSNIHIERRLGTGGDIGAAGTSGLLSLTAGDTVELWAQCTTTAGASITVRDANLWLEKIK